MIEDRTTRSDTTQTLLSILGIALVVRFVVFSALSRSAYLDLLELDMQSYHEMALRISGGHLRPTDVFYQSPLYAYFLGGLYWLFGSSLWVSRIANGLLGVASSGLLFGLGSYYFSRRAGIVSALALTAYGPLLLEEYSVLKTALVVFLLLLSLTLIVVYRQTARRSVLVGAGVCFGLLCTAAGQFLIGLPLIAICLLIGPRLEGQKRFGGLLPAALLIAGSLLPLGPIVTWNSHAGGGLLLTSADAGLNLYMGNNPRSAGLPARPYELRDNPTWEQKDSQRIAEKASGRQLNAAEVSRYWTRETLSFVRHDPRRFLRGLLRKLEVLWNAYEVPDDRHYAFTRSELVPLLWLLPTFALVGPFALFGMAIGLKKWRSLLLTYAVSISYLGVLVLFYVRGRYRLAAMPLFALFAGAGVEALLVSLRSRRWPPIVFSVSLLALGSAIVNHVYIEPAQSEVPSFKLGDTLWFDAQYWLGAQYYQSAPGGHDYETALEFTEKGLAVSNQPAISARLYDLQGGIHLSLYRREREAMGNPLTPPSSAAIAELQKAASAYTQCLKLGYSSVAAQQGLREIRQILNALPQ